MLAMANPRKPKREQSKDRHAAHHMVRLPIELYEELEEEAKRNGRPVSWEIRMRLERTLREDKEGGNK